MSYNGNSKDNNDLAVVDKILSKFWVSHVDFEIATDSALVCLSLIKNSVTNGKRGPNLYMYNHGMASDFKK